MKDYSGPPWRWIARDGRPAAVLGSLSTSRIAGLPSYELDDGTRNTKWNFAVMEFLVAKQSKKGYMMLYPKEYATDATYFQDGLCSMWLDTARQWRPLLYVRGRNEWISFGSQNELSYRYAIKILASRDPDWKDQFDAMGRAEKKADELLLENLTGFQCVEWMAHRRFRVRGGLTGDLYMVRGGNGFAKVEPMTGTELQAYCLHPEYWIPESDIALAHKLQLENPETELDALEQGRRSAGVDPVRRPKPEQRLAYDIEREAAFV